MRLFFMACLFIFSFNGASANESEFIENFRYLKNAYVETIEEKVELKIDSKEKEVMALVTTWAVGEVSLRLIAWDTAQYISITRGGGDAIFNGFMANNRTMFQSRAIKNTKVTLLTGARWIWRISSLAIGGILIALESPKVGEGSSYYAGSPEGFIDFLELDEQMALDSAEPAVIKKVNSLASDLRFANEEKN